MDLDRIKVNRTGDHAQSFMITDAVLGIVEPGKRYQITLNGLVLSDANISESFKKKSKYRHPLMCSFTARGSRLTMEKLPTQIYWVDQERYK